MFSFYRMILMFSSVSFALICAVPYVVPMYFDYAASF